MWLRFCRTSSRKEKGLLRRRRKKRGFVTPQPFSGGVPKIAGDPGKKHQIVDFTAAVSILLSFSGGGYFSASENVLASLRRAAPRLLLVVWVPHNGVSAPREGTPSFYARVRTFVPVVTCSITCATPPGVTGSPSPPVFHEDFAACTPRLTVVSYYSRFWVRTTDIEEVSEPGPSSVVEITRETSMGRIAVWARDGEASSNAINPGVYFG